jgi:hypothetical protein
MQSIPNSHPLLAHPLLLPSLATALDGGLLPPLLSKVDLDRLGAHALVGAGVVERRAALALLGALCALLLRGRLGQRLGDLDGPCGLFGIADREVVVVPAGRAVGRVLVVGHLAPLLPARHAVVLAVLLLLLGLGVLARLCVRVRCLSGVWGGG